MSRGWLAAGTLEAPSPDRGRDKPTNRAREDQRNCGRQIQTPPRFDLKSADGSFGRLVQIGGTTIVVVFAVVLVFYIVTSRDDKKDGVAGPGDAVRVTSSKLVTQPGTSNPKAVVSFYEDFLCPACGIFERGFGPAVSKLVDIGAVAADYTMVAILDSASNQHYSSRAAAAAYCVADESIEAFRRFHAALFSKDIQPAELGKDFPDNARLIELAREAGVVGKVPDCINSGKYIEKSTGWRRRSTCTRPRRSGSMAQSTSGRRRRRWSPRSKKLWVMCRALTRPLLPRHPDDCGGSSTCRAIRRPGCGAGAGA